MTHRAKLPSKKWRCWLGGTAQVGNDFCTPPFKLSINLVFRVNPGFSVGEGLAPPVLKLLPFGECIKEQINNLEIRYENVKIDNYVIMPNHIHILMRIENQTGGASPSPTVSDIICAFKSLSTLECKKLLPIDILFQRSYHDHIIRDDIDYQQIWQYIDENPTKWADYFGIATRFDTDDRWSPLQYPE